MDLHLSMTRRTAVLGVATLLAAGGAVAVGLSGDSSAPKASAAPYGSVLAADSTAVAPDAFPGITVQGTGKVTGTPDTLVLTLTVSKTAGDVSSAMNDLSATMAAVQKSLSGDKVAAADQKTSGLNVGPQYEDTNGKTTVTGYQASENLTVTLRDTKAAGGIIAAASGAGGNATQISGLSTDLQNDSGPLSQARDAAFNDAKAKAAQYAKAAGRTLGQVVRVEESDANAGPSPVEVPRAAAADATNPVPIQLGSTDITVRVTVVFGFA